MTITFSKIQKFHENFNLVGKMYFFSENSMIFQKIKKK